VRITPKPIQKPLPTYVGSFQSVDRACAGSTAADRGAVRRGHELWGLKQVADLITRPAPNTAPSPAADVQLFHAFRRRQTQEDAQRAADPLLQGMRDPGVSERPKTAPPSYRYSSTCRSAAEGEAGDLTENSVLLGSSARMIETLKKVEAAGFDEVILYFNVGQKRTPRSRTRWRVSCRVAPSFAASRNVDAA